MQSDSTTEETNNASNKFLGTWPHKFNSAFACLGCTIGVFNIDRFSIYSVQYGVNFIIQFLIMSVIFGIPLFTLQVCLGQRLKAGVLNMWKISPIFQGVGVALLIVQTCIGIYNIVGVSWLLVYLRDSFITNHETYRWVEDFVSDKSDLNLGKNLTQNKVTELTFTYFNRIVLHRQDLDQQYLSTTMLKFQIVFNLAVMWILVFFSLSKGIRSYGKVINYYVLVALFCNLLFFIKILNLIPQGSSNKIYSSHHWSELFLNSKSWIAATSEAFFTWGLLGAAAMQIAVHKAEKKFLMRDIMMVVIFTVLTLLLNAFVANTCVKVFKVHGYTFAEKDEGKLNEMLIRHPNYKSALSSNNMSRTAFLFETVINTDSIKKYGNQVLRYSTELVPLTIALLGTPYFAAFWTVSFYLALVLFGLIQQLAIWNCVIMGISSINRKKNKNLNIEVVFLSCLCGFCLGLPMATELGSYVIYYLDYIIGRSWWVVVLYLMQCVVVIVVRGKPYNIMKDEIFLSPNAFLQSSIKSMLTFSWNIVLPTVLTALSIVIFKIGGFGELYFNQKERKSYWTVWAKQIGITIQLIPLLIIPGVAIIQACRYLSSGQQNIFKRLQLLCRSPLETEHSENVRQCESDVMPNIRENEGFQSTSDLIIEDSPPKYTPPPSYTTATGAKMAKFLRRSFRRSIRSVRNMLSESNIMNPKRLLISAPPDYKL